MAQTKQTLIKKWQEKNRETRYLRNRSASRSFIKNQAIEEDLEDLM